MLARLLLLPLALLAIGSDAAPVPITPATFVDWPADHGGDRVSAGGLVVTNATLPCKAGGDLSPGHCWHPAARIERPGAPAVDLVGTEGTSARLAIGPIAPGRLPSVILETFTGGAHCCNEYRIALPVGAGYQLLTLARATVNDQGPVVQNQFDGGLAAFPRDVSGDGIADFVLSDDAFDYAFSSYAGSMAPPVVLDLVAGRFVDVSTRKAFAPLFAKQMAEARQACTATGDVEHNGACAAYAADAARLGRFAEAWPVVLAHYDQHADQDWVLKRCTAALVDGHCPAGKEIAYKDYPAALRDFLVRHGYLAR